MPTVKPAWIWSAASVAFVAILLAAFLQMWKDWTIGEHAWQQSMPECPHEWTRFSVNAGKQHQQAFPSLSTGTLTVPGPITSVPEYHDCQRFIEGESYGGLAAVFAAHNLDELKFTLDSLRDSSVFVDSATRTTRAYAVAEVFLQDGAPYPALGIELGFNCLFFYYRNETLEARMLPVGMDESRCGAPFNPMTTSGKRLTVNPLPVAATFKPGDIPAVARWDRDPASLTYYIGLGCRTAWCEVGSAGSSSVFDPGSALRVRAIKGWYDEQHLALPHPTVPRQWQPANFQGTVIPSPTLPTQANYDAQWLPTSYVALPSSSGYYQTTLNLAQTVPGADMSGLNRIELCRGTWSECLIPAGYAFPKRTCGPLNGTFSKAWPRWWARITPAGGGNPQYRCVIRRDHSSVNHWPPHTARWRWMVRDETIWQECTRGCCEIEVDGS